MDLRAITVECYAGSRADERPKRVIIEGREHVVARLIEETLDESSDSKVQRRRFKLLTNEGIVLDVIRSSDGAWYLSPDFRRRGEGQPTLRKFNGERHSHGKG